MKWYEAAIKYESEIDGQLESLSDEWQRELVALERAISDIFNGGYVQFLANRGRESYVYASQALKKIGAHTMAEIIDRCQALVEEHFPTEGKSPDELTVLMANEIRSPKGKVLKKAGSVLPDSVVDLIDDLSSNFIGDPDDYHKLAQSYFGPLIKTQKRG